MKINLVEYNEKYAKSMAEMWNASSEGWCGEKFNKTESTVIAEERNSNHIKLWLALDGNDVVGYCKLSEYKEDEGALYIDLLNVRPDYFSKKIGKMLVLRAVEETIRMNWPRVDLYTWAGNTKATPLYKKCGFFWEDRDDSTHLMNFIPTVLNTEFVKDYFEDADWYSDSTRVIEVVPDGREENGFDFFAYTWEMDGKKLEMEFCRRGRGLRKIVTDEYSIEVSLPQLKHVFGRKYDINYTIKNFTSKALPIKLKGIDHKNITSDFNEEIVVDKQAIITKEFNVGNVDKVQSQWHTHPCVKAEMLVNGKKAGLSLGIEPVFPVNLTLKTKKEIYKTNRDDLFFIELENSFDENIVISFKLESTADLEVLQKKWETELEPKERKCLEVPCRLLSSCVYEQTIKVAVKTETGDEVTFSKFIGDAFHTIGGLYMGKSETKLLIGAGKYCLDLEKDVYRNETMISDVDTRKGGVGFLPPMLGMPFSSEMHKIAHEKLCQEKIDGKVRMSTTYSSKDFHGLKLTMINELSPGGMMERWFEVANTADTATEKEVMLCDRFWLDMSNGIFPYAGRIIEQSEGQNCYAELWDADKLFENWMFVSPDKKKIGIGWEENVKLQFSDWDCLLEHNLGKLLPGQIAQTGKVTVAISTFDNWEYFRAYLTDNKPLPQLSDNPEFIINDGNPVISGNIEVKLIEHTGVVLSGTIELNSLNGIIGETKESFNREKEALEWSKIIPCKSYTGIDVINLESRMEDYAFDRARAVIRVDNNRQIECMQEGKVSTLNNGIIEFKTDSSFAPVLHSMKYKGNEWLHSEYPNRVCKSWWNPWTGGIFSYPGRMSMKSIVNEKITTDFVEGIDTLGNHWTGIRININVEKDEKFEGLSWQQYYLTLPGAPVMMYHVQINNNSGRFIKELEFKTNAFINPAEKLSDSWIKLKRKDGTWSWANAGNISNELITERPAVFGGNGRNEMLQVLIDRQITEQSSESTSEAIFGWYTERISCRNKHSVTVPPKLFIFTDKELEDKWMQDLKNIRFDVNTFTIRK